MGAENQVVELAFVEEFFLVEGFSERPHIIRLQPGQDVQFGKFLSCRLDFPRIGLKVAERHARLVKAPVRKRLMVGETECAKSLPHRFGAVLARRSHRMFATESMGMQIDPLAEFHNVASLIRSTYPRFQEKSIPAAAEIKKSEKIELPLDAEGVFRYN